MSKTDSIDLQSPDGSSGVPVIPEPHPLADRFGASAPTVPLDDAPESTRTMLTRSSCRSFTGDEVPRAVVTLVVAAALSAPSKSDLQQATIIELDDPLHRRDVCELSPANAWALGAPVVFVVRADGSRIRHVATRLGRPFPDEHLDQFMNAVVDAGIVLSAAVHAADR